MKKNELTQEIVRELLRYEPDTGKLFWLERSEKWFKDSHRTAKGNCNNWNACCAGKEAFSGSKWDGYFKGKIFGKPYLAHRLIWVYMTGEWPDEVDHINGVRDDNRWGNLRNVNHQENQRNQKLRKDNTSGICCVRRNKRDKKWYANIKHNGVQLFLGCFGNIEDAIAARKAAEIKYCYHENHGRTA